MYYKNCKTFRILSISSLVYAVSLNLISPHQEIRFLLPSLPGLHLFIASFVIPNVIMKKHVHPESHLLAQSKSSDNGNVLAKPKTKMSFQQVNSATMVAVFMVHILAAVYLATMHQVCSKRYFLVLQITASVFLRI